MMKFELNHEMFNAVIGLMREAPVPHRVSDPVIRALVDQANNPVEVASSPPGPIDLGPARAMAPLVPPAVPTKRRGRPLFSKNKPKANGLDDGLAGDSHAEPEQVQGSFPSA